jgi:hypothetical protein
MREYSVPSGTHPHDVAPARDGGVWYTAQASGRLGWLDPKSGRSRLTRLGSGSAPHGVIVGPDGAPWITDSGLNAIVRVDPRTRRVVRFPLPATVGYANLNTATFDRRGVLCHRAERHLRPSRPFQLQIPGSLLPQPPPFFRWAGPRVRLFAPSELVSGKFVHSAEFMRLALNAGGDSGGTCFGDSGGPDLLGGSDTVLAVNSYVTNVNCSGVGYSSRVDIPEVLDWIESFM